MAKFQIKRTAIAGRTPNTTSSGNTTFIDTGELALNITDGKLFSSNGSALIEFGTGTPVYDENGVLISNTYVTTRTTDLSAVMLSVLPSISNTYDIGSSSFKWRDVYVGNVLVATNGSFTNINATSVNVGANVNLSTTQLKVGNSTVNTTITSNLVTTTQVKFAGAAGFPLLDTSSQDASYANGAQVHFPNFSGMVIVNNTGTTGQIMMTICGGGSVAVLDYSGTGIPHKTGTIYSNGTISGYTWVNDSGATDTFTFAAIKTRNSG